MITREGKYKNYGRVLEVEEGNLILRITLDVGPRIIYYGTKDYNIFYEDIDRKAYLKDQKLEQIYGSGAMWYLLGGHRLWKSPEDITSYTPDCKANVTIGDNIIKVSCPEDKVTRLIKEFEIELLAQNKVRVSHRFINNASEEKEVAIWALSVLRAQGTLYIPLNKNDKDLLPAKNIVYWSYSDYEDVRFAVEQDYAYLKQRQDMDHPFKIGMLLENGVVGYRVDDILFIKTFDVNLQAKYPDLCCNFESYTNGNFIECESISGLELLAMEEKMEHTEVWDFVEGIVHKTEDDIKQLINDRI